MIYRFTLISDETDDFRREIKIAPEATFYDFHKAILTCVGYEDNQMTSFFICDDDWEKETEITLEEMDNDPESDSWIMDETPLNKLIEEEKQKVLYVFDYLTERCFFIELTEIIVGKEINKPLCNRKEGTPPPQFIEFEEAPTISPSPTPNDDFFKDKYLDTEELDLEDFDLDDFDEEVEDFHDDDGF